MPRIPPSHRTGRIGVSSLRLKVERDLEWLFREQQEDYGIDAQIEVVSDSKPTGKIIAAQVKSGDCFFEERTADGIVFRGDNDHLEYWLKHKLPVIVVLHYPDSDIAYWQSVTEEHIERTRKGWKMVVPERQTIDASHAEQLERVSNGTPYFQRLANLQLARSWMQLLESGSRLFVVAEEWVNKTSGRCSIALVLQDADGEESTLQEWGYYVYFPGHGIVYGLQTNFPWADFSIDQDAYEESEDEAYTEECGHYDKEDGQYYYHESREEWNSGRDSGVLRPYEIASGELALWRLEMSLNDVGRSFLLMDKFLSGVLVRQTNEEFS